MAKEQKKEMTEEEKQARLDRLAKGRVLAQAKRKRKAERKKRVRAQAQKAISRVEFQVTHGLAAKQAVADADQFVQKRNATAFLAALRACQPEGLEMHMSVRAIELARQTAQNVTQEYGATALRFTHAAKRATTQAQDFEKADQTLRLHLRFPIVSSNDL